MFPYLIIAIMTVAVDGEIWELLKQLIKANIIQFFAHTL